jgi:hypothetical protein
MTAPAVSTIRVRAMLKTTAPGSDRVVLATARGSCAMPGLKPPY